MEVRSWLHYMHRKPRLFPLGYFQVSTTVETFQDLSLPIPGKEDLAKLHSAIYQTVPAKTGACGDNYASQGWIAFIMEYIRRFVVSCIPSWFWGPVVTLEDCLAAFFAADELKGDNMYSCERCKKLRNGVKYCKVLRLPEVSKSALTLTFLSVDTA